MRRMIWGLVAAIGLATTSQAAPIQVGLELSLLVDVSGSVSPSEFNLQRQGYVNAFNSAAVQGLIANTPGGIAANFIYWSGSTQQQQVVGWTHLTNAAQSTAFATAIGAAAQPFSGLTAPGSAINFAVPLFASNNFDGLKQVIDVSGDGSENDGANTLIARNNALAAGIDNINGLPILGESGLLAFYQNNIQGGTGSFTQPAANFNDFDAAVRLKLFREIGSVNEIPEPATLAVFGGIALAGALGYRRRKATATA